MRVGATEFVEKPVTPRAALRGAVDRALRPRRERARGRPRAGGRRLALRHGGRAPRPCAGSISSWRWPRPPSAGCSSRGSGARARSWWPGPSTPCRRGGTGPSSQLNCAAIPAELIESEMFGHVKGAFTGAVADRKGKFESADRGDPLPRRDRGHEPHHPGQAPARAPGGRGHARGQLGDAGRWTCGSSPPPARTSREEIERGAFRDDLYDRINVLNIAVPPLRSRREDIPDLAEHFLRLASVENGFRPKRLSPRGRRLPEAAALAGQRARAAQRHGAAGGPGAPRRRDPPRRDVGPADGRGGGGGRRRAAAPAPGARRGSSGSTSWSASPRTAATWARPPASWASSARTSTAR